MSRLLEIGSTKDSIDPCEDTLTKFLDCCKGKSKNEKRELCYGIASEYIECRTNPQKFKEAIDRYKKKA